MDWFRSYLNGRTQYVRSSTTSSSPSAIVYGVPQGLVLELILFLLYTADLLQLVIRHHLHPHAYADDTQIYGSCRLLRQTLTCYRNAIYRKTPVQSGDNLTVYICTISGWVDLTCILNIFCIFLRSARGLASHILYRLPARSSRFGDTPEHRYIYIHTCIYIIKI